MKSAKLLLIVLLLLGAGYLSMVGGTIVGKPMLDTTRAQGLLLLVGAALLVVAAVLLTDAPRKKVRKALSVAFVVWVLGSAMFGPVIISAKVAARSGACDKNLRALSTSIHIYIASSDDVFPPADRWATVIGHDEPPKCPVATSPYSYAMNRNLSKVPFTEIAEPGRTVLIFEMDAQTPNASGTEGDVVDRHGRPKAVMTDGHVGTSRSARWQP